MKNENSLSTTLTNLTQELHNFKALIEITRDGLVNGVSKDEIPLEAIFIVISNLLKLINEFKMIKSLILLEQDYINFCLLLVYGSEMAAALLKLKNCPDNSRQHAKAWKEIASEFTLLLNNNIYNSI